MAFRIADTFTETLARRHPDIPGYCLIEQVVRILECPVQPPARGVLPSRLPANLEVRLDRARWVVKGGVNLRAWFGSVRHSEDLDIDLIRGSVHSTRERIAALPEVEIPSNFDKREARRWVRRIPKGPRRRAVQQRLEALLR